jgi:hypothetical protein
MTPPTSSESHPQPSAGQASPTNFGHRSSFVPDATPWHPQTPSPGPAQDHASAAGPPGTSEIYETAERNHSAELLLRDAMFPVAQQPTMPNPTRGGPQNLPDFPSCPNLSHQSYPSSFPAPSQSSMHHDPFSSHWAHPVADTPPWPGYDYNPRDYTHLADRDGNNGGPNSGWYSGSTPSMLNMGAGTVPSVAASAPVGVISPRWLQTGPAWDQMAVWQPDTDREGGSMMGAADMADGGMMGGVGVRNIGSLGSTSTWPRGASYPQLAPSMMRTPGYMAQNTQLMGGVSGQVRPTPTCLTMKELSIDAEFVSRSCGNLAA